MAASKSFDQINVEITAADGIILRGALWAQASAGAPVIVMSHGFGVVKDMTLNHVGQDFAEAGFNCLLYDHRCLGISDGFPRDHVDPWQQVSDCRDVVTFACNLPGADGSRVGIWGTSYSGGHALVIGATDRRVRAVVAQGATISGSRNALRRFPGDALAQSARRYAADRTAVLRGADLEKIQQVADATEEDRHHIAETPDQMPLGNSSREWMRSLPPEAMKTWNNRLTLRSYELYRAYEPGGFIARIAPTPLLLITGDDDTVTPTDDILAAYNEAREPKRLKIVPGGHYDIYASQRRAVTNAAIEFFREFL